MDGSVAVQVAAENYILHSTCHYRLRLKPKMSARQVTVRKELLAPQRRELRADDVELGEHQRVSLAWTETVQVCLRLDRGRLGAFDSSKALPAITR